MSFDDRDEGREVTDPERTESTAKGSDAETMRPIPDGGLQQSMPEWLRRPPAWRNLPKREEPAGASADGPVAVQERELPAQLPEPDTSEIDPRSLVGIEDLPRWLQDLAARSEASSSPPVTTYEPEPEPDATEEHTMREPENRVDDARTDTARDVTFEPVDKKKWAIPDEETKVYGGPRPAGPNWPLLIGGAILALIVIILVVSLLL